MDFEEIIADDIVDKSLFPFWEAEKKRKTGDVATHSQKSPSAFSLTKSKSEATNPVRDENTRSSLLSSDLVPIISYHVMTLQCS